MGLPGLAQVRGLDALDGTPVIDIKPYIPSFDGYPDAQIPKWVASHLNSSMHGAHDHPPHEAIRKSDASGSQG